MTTGTTFTMSRSTTTVKTAGGRGGGAPASFVTLPQEAPQHRPVLSGARETPPRSL